MSSRTLAWILAAGTTVYMVLAALVAWPLIFTGDPVLMLFGVGIVVIPVLGVWLIWRELMFGRRTQYLGHQLAVEGGFKADASTGSVDERVAQLQETALAHPDDWRNWYRLAMGYDDARDRRRARGAMREAIRIHDQ